MFYACVADRRKRSFLLSANKWKYLSKCGRTSSLNVMSSTKVQVMSVQNATGKTNTFTHHIILFKPENKKETSIEASNFHISSQSRIVTWTGKYIHLLNICKLKCLKRNTYSTHYGLHTQVSTTMVRETLSPYDSFMYSSLLKLKKKNSLKLNKGNLEVRNFSPFCPYFFRQFV